MNDLHHFDKGTSATTLSRSETYPHADKPAIAKLLHYELRLACCAAFGFSSSETDEEHEERNDKAVVKTGFPH